MIELNKISFAYPNSNTKIFDKFSLKIEDGEIVSLLGQSGLGKTTLASLITGYLRVSSGDILIGNKALNKPSKKVLMINQENDLFDWMTVYENMKIATDNDEIIDKYLKLTHLESDKNLYPYQLSGGMKKRLSIARAFAAQSKCIVMDEPFGSLDVQTKEALQNELLAIITKDKKTIILITHDIEEALYLSDMVYILKGLPIKIVNKYEIKFPKPRDNGIKSKVEFVRLMTKIINLI